MLIDSEELMKRLNEIDAIYERANNVGIPSYPIFKSLIQGLEMETKGGN